MKDMWTIGSFVLGFVVATSLAGTYAWRKGLFRANDDEPIVVAGGTFEIGSLNGFKRIDAHHLSHKLPKSTVKRIDLLYNDQANGPSYQKFLVTGDIKVDIEYKHDQCTPPSTVDKVTFGTINGGHGLGVSNDLNCPGVGDDPSVPTNISHQPTTGKMGKITVSGNGVPAADAHDYPCENNKCQVVLHYCKNTGSPDCL